MTKLGEWRKGKGWTQGDLADKIEEPRPTYQKWESGVSLGIPPEIQAKLRKAGYTGPWPQEEAKEKAQPQAGDYITREEFAEWRGYWRAGEEKVLKRIEDLEDQVRKLSQREGSE